MIQDSACDPVGWAARHLTLAGLESPRLEAQLLLALALGTTRTAVIAGLFAPLNSEGWQRFEGLVTARAARVPLAYLRGSQEFYGLDFNVRSAVLIPRPETEMLVDFALERMRPNTEHPTPNTLCFADVGTGSGCIAVSALVHCPGSRCVAFDLSADALQVARANAARHGVLDRLELAQSDLLSDSPIDLFDVILSNPPYIATPELENLQPEVRESEPRIALDGGPDGLDIYRRLAPAAFPRLKPAGALAVEVGMGQAPALVEIFRASGFCDIEIRKDLAGIERLVAGYRQTPNPEVKPEPIASVNRETGLEVEWQPKV